MRELCYNEWPVQKLSKKILADRPKSESDLDFLGIQKVWTTIYTSRPNSTGAEPSHPAAKSASTLPPRWAASPNWSQFGLLCRAARMAEKIATRCWLVAGVTWNAVCCTWHVAHVLSLRHAAVGAVLAVRYSAWLMSVIIIAFDYLR